MLMKFFRNPSTGEVSAFEWPKDQSWVDPALVEMTDEEVESHVNPPQPEPDRAEVERRRLIAYADPVSGCDRYFSEAQRMQAMGEDGWEAARNSGVARFEEIQSIYPWP